MTQQERDARIIALRREGHAPIAIRQKMGISKNIVAGVLWRAGLTTPAPTKRKPRKSCAERVAITAARKAALPNATPQDVAAPEVALEKRQPGTGIIIDPTLPPVLPALRLMAAVAKHGPRKCCWPFGDPRTPEFRFCGEPVAEKSYCRVHHDRAYLKMRRHEVADAA